MKKINNKGFTIVELIMAMAFFSFVLSMILFGFIQIVRAYRGGVITHRTQLALRDVVNDITEEVHDSQSLELTTDNGITYLCGSRAVYIYDKSLGSLKKEALSNDIDCSSVENIPNDDAAKNLLPDSLMVSKFEAESKTVGGKQVGVNIDMEVATNQLDLLKEEDGRKICDPSLKGSQFCEVSRLATSIAIRPEGAE